MLVTTQEKLERALLQSKELVEGGYVRESAIWLERIAELERLSQQGGIAAARLVELLCLYGRACSEGWYEVSRTAALGDDPIDTPFWPLLQSLMKSASYALICLGSEAAEALVRAYEAAAVDAPERVYILYTLARIGAPNQADFLQRLTENDIRAAYRADAEIVERGFTTFMPEVRKMNESELEENIRQFLIGIRSKYEQARAQREGGEEASESAET